MNRQWDIMRNEPVKPIEEQIFDKIQELRQCGVDADAITFVLDGMNQRQQIRKLRQWALDLEYWGAD